MLTLDTMEVLNLAAAALFNSLEKHNINKDLLIAGTNLKAEDISNPKKKHTWDQFVKMYENCALLLGPDLTVKEISTQGIYNEKISPIINVATGLLDAKTIYWYTATFVAKHLFKESVTFTYSKIKTNHVSIQIDIHPDLVDCPLLLETYTYLFEILPNLLGLPKARVTSRITERRGEYHIYLKHTSFFKLLYAKISKVFDGDESTIKLMTELENQSIELSRVIEEKSQLLRVVSHDIANQVSVIDFYLKKTMKNEVLSDEGQRYLNVAKNSSSKLYSILKNVQNLEISSINGVTAVPVNLEGIFLSLSDHFQPQLKHKKLSLKCRNELVYNMAVLAEATSLETNVIGNLLTNAIKFSPEGSVIELEAKLQGDRVLISVIDQGVGISLEERQSIFTKKIRNSSLGTNGEMGTGFGLGIATNYVKLYGGKISVQPNFPKGSIFTIELEAHMPQIISNQTMLNMHSPELNPRN